MDLLSEVENKIAELEIPLKVLLELRCNLKEVKRIFKNYEIESKMVHDMLDELCELDEPAEHSHSCQCNVDLDATLLNRDLPIKDMPTYFCGNTIDQLKKCSTFIKLTEHCSGLKEFDSEDSSYLTDPIDQDYNLTFTTNIGKMLVFICEKASCGSQEKYWSLLAIYNFALKNHRYMNDYPKFKLALVRRWKECLNIPAFVDYLKANVPSYLRWKEIFGGD